MKLGLIVLADNNAELLAVIKKLQGSAGVTTEMVETTSPAAQDDMDFDEEPTTEKLKVPTAAELKTILTEVRDANGVEALKEILTSFGATSLKTLAKSDWASAYASAAEMLKGGDDDLDDGLNDGLDDDDLGGDDDLGDVPDADVVKTATQVYARKHGKEKATKALKDSGLNSVRGLKASTDEQRAKLWAIVGS